MKVDVTYEKENPLFKRKEIVAYVSGIDHTPSKSDVKKELAGKMKSKEDSISIEEIFQIFGGDRVKVKAKIYSAKEDMDNTEKRNKKKLLKAEEEAKKKAAESAAETPVEAPKEETKVEEVKEEAPKEEAPKEESKDGEEGNKE